jgi:hypothetical protein
VGDTRQPAVHLLPFQLPRMPNKAHMLHQLMAHSMNNSQTSTAMSVQQHQQQQQQRLTSEPQAPV